MTGQQSQILLYLYQNLSKVPAHNDNELVAFGTYFKEMKDCKFLICVIFFNHCRTSCDRAANLKGDMMSEDPASNVTDKSVQQQPSETAMATATMRAIAAHDEREEIRGPDDLAEL